MASASHIRVVAELSEEQLLHCLSIANSASTPNTDGCVLVDVHRDTRLSLNSKGYVQIKVINHFNANKKVQLHQLVTWMHPNLTQRAVFRAAIINKEGGLEISHLCRNKSCMNPTHFVAEASGVNKSRNYCEVVVHIDGDTFSMCRHMPPCIATKSDFERMFVFE